MANGYNVEPVQDFMDSGHYNRLVIVGNGFDLNLGLKTSYNDFMVWLIKKAMQDALNGKRGNPLLNIPDLSYKGTTAHYRNEIESINTLTDLKKVAEEIGSPEILNFKHPFVQQLFGIASGGNWVDIEYEYFLKLKGLVERNEKFIHPKFLEDLRKLNDGLEKLTNELREYIRTIDAGVPVEDKVALYYSDLFSEQIPLRVHGVDQIRELKEITVLSFNYTNSLSKIHGRIQGVTSDVIAIHGFAHGGEEIIFGYGDDTDEFFRHLEAQNMNELLRHIKSFQYGLGSNYSKLLRCIDASPLEVIVAGHSCGISDRTLLKTIFEHPNCRAIRILHRGSKQDYVEKYINISRHFTDKVRMRQVVQPYDENFAFLKK